MQIRKYKYVLTPSLNITYQISVKLTKKQLQMTSNTCTLDKSYMSDIIVIISEFFFDLVLHHKATDSQQIISHTSRKTHVS